MSAGVFETAAYETSSTALGGAIMSIKVQPETLALEIGAETNAGSTTPIDLPLRVRVNGGNSEYGVKPRKALLRFTGTAPAGYSGQDVSVPLVNLAITAVATPGATGTYLGEAVEVISTTPERFR